MSDTRALLLDLDGTLADSLGVMRDAYDRFLDLYGCEGTDEEFDALNGPPLAEVVRQLKDRRRLEGSHEDLLAQYRALLDAVYSEVPAAPGAEALLHEARSAGWATAVVTSAPSTLARTWLRAAGIETLIDEVVGGDMVTRGKPHPDAYLVAVAAVKAAPRRSLAVEDSSQGVAAALAAGIPTLLYRPSSDSPVPPPGVIGVVGHLDEVRDHLR